MFVLYLIKTSDASERTRRRRPLLVRLVIARVSHNFFKKLILTFDIPTFIRKFEN